MTKSEKLLQIKKECLTLEKLKKLEKSNLSNDISLYLSGYNLKKIDGEKNIIYYEGKDGELAYIHFFSDNKIIFAKINNYTGIKTLIRFNNDKSLEGTYSYLVEAHENGIIFLETYKNYNLEEIALKRYSFSNEKISKLYPKELINLDLFMKKDGVNIVEKSSYHNIKPGSANTFDLYLKEKRIFNGKKIIAKFNGIDVSKECKGYDIDKIFSKKDILDTLMFKEIDSDIKYIFENSLVHDEEYSEIGKILRK